MLASQPLARRGWLGKLRLTMRPRAGRTRVVEQSHEGPLTIQRAFYPEGDGTAHVVLLHPPGGMVGGDRLVLEAEVAANASALITTPGATKIYRSNGEEALSSATLQVNEDASGEYVPQETVVFDGADARLHTEVHLAKGARFLGWEVVCLGRPAANTTFRRGRVRLRFDVKREGRLLVSERGLIDGDEGFANASWGLQGQAAFGTLVATEGSLDDVRAALGDEGAATVVSGLLVVRALARDGVRVRGVLEKARHCVRRAWGRPEIDPAIWRT